MTKLYRVMMRQTVNIGKRAAVMTRTLAFYIPVDSAAESVEGLSGGY